MVNYVDVHCTIVFHVVTLESNLNLKSSKHWTQTDLTANVHHSERCTILCLLNALPSEKPEEALSAERSSATSASQPTCDFFKVRPSFWYT